MAHPAGGCHEAVQPRTASSSISRRKRSHPGRACVVCGAVESCLWRRHENGFICNKCGCKRRRLAEKKAKLTADVRCDNISSPSLSLDAGSGAVDVGAPAAVVAGATELSRQLSSFGIPPVRMPSPSLLQQQRPAPPPQLPHVAQRQLLLQQLRQLRRPPSPAQVILPCPPLPAHAAGGLALWQAALLARSTPPEMLQHPVVTLPSLSPAPSLTTADCCAKPAPSGPHAAHDAPATSCHMVMHATRVPAEFARLPSDAAWQQLLSDSSISDLAMSLFD